MPLSCAQLFLGPDLCIRPVAGSVCGGELIVRTGPRVLGRVPPLLTPRSDSGGRVPSPPSPPWPQMFPLSKHRLSFSVFLFGKYGRVSGRHFLLSECLKANSLWRLSYT